jgi:hypothetical protein
MNIEKRNQKLAKKIKKLEKELDKHLAEGIITQEEFLCMSKKVIEIKNCKGDVNNEM